jgi:hypothetical protein
MARYSISVMANPLLRAFQFAPPLAERNTPPSLPA